MANEVRIKLTDEQRSKIKKATGKDMSELRVSSVGSNPALSGKSVSARSARSAESMRSARAAESARTARAAETARTARSAETARTARSTESYRAGGGEDA